MNEQRKRLLEQNRQDSIKSWKQMNENSRFNNNNNVGDGGTGSAGGGGSATGSWFWMLQGPYGNENSSLLKVNIETGQYLHIGGTGVRTLAGIALDPSDGTLWSNRSGAHTTYTIKPNTGSATLVGSTGLSDNIPDLTIGDDLIIRAWSEQTDDPVIINRSTGAAIVTATSGLGTGGTGVANTLEPGVCYVKPNNELYKVNWSTGDYQFVCEYTEITDGYGELQNGLSNWGDNLAGLQRNSGEGGSTATRFYKLDLDGNATYLSTVQFSVSGLAYDSTMTDPYEGSLTPIADGWSVVTGGSAGDGTVTQTGPGEYIIVGPDEPTESTGWTYIKRFFPDETDISITMRYSTEDDDYYHDVPYILQTELEPTGQPATHDSIVDKEIVNQCLHVTIEGPTWFQIGIWSDDSVAGPGSLEVKIEKFI